jgi:hypothetical protein
MPRLLGVYERPDHLAEVVLRLRGRGYTDLETYSPAPFAEVDDAVHEGPSGVRLWTLIGGLTGVVTGYALTLWMANNWQLMLGGKPFSSIPPYTIIAFELTILFGGILTVLGLFALGRLYPRKADAAYSPRFSAEEFGVVVSCRERDVAEIEELMRSHEAVEVTLVES